MACTVKYRNNKIDKVITPEGKESKLFKELASLPMNQTLEDALEKYKNIYSEELQKSSDFSENTYNEIRSDLYDAVYERLEEEGRYNRTNLNKELDLKVRESGTPIQKRLLSKDFTKGSNTSMILLSEIEDFAGENRTANRKRIDEIKTSIDKNGLKEPLILRYNEGEAAIIEGNHRIIALKELGFEYIPIEIKKDPFMSDIDRVKQGMQILKKTETPNQPQKNGSVNADDLGFTYFDIDNTDYRSTEDYKEPSLQYKSDKGETFDSFKEALLNSEGGDIQVGVEANGFKKLVTVNSNTNPNNVQGFVNNLVKSGILSDTKLVEEGESYFMPEGGSDQAQVVNKAITENEAAVNLSSSNISAHKDGRIQITGQKGEVTINGEKVKLSELRELTYRELITRFPDLGAAIKINTAVKDATTNTFGENTSQQKTTETYSEAELRERLTNLLSAMGVKVMSIDAYLKSYKSRNYVDADAKALADIANQVIAFKDGEISIEELTEETAHFIVEAWDEAEIQNLLRNIHKTAEWAEFSEAYREIYQDENLVRKEVLGKVLANALQQRFSKQNKTESQSNILDRIAELFNQFFQKVSSLFTPQNQQDLNKFTESVEDLLLNQDINNYLNTEQFQNKKFNLYSLGFSPKKGTPEASLKDYTQNLLRTLLEQEKDLLRAGKGLKSNVKKLKELEDAIDKNKITDSILDLVTTANRQTQYIVEAAERANRNGEFLSNEEGVVYSSLKDVLQPTLNVLNEAVSKSDDVASKEKVQSMIKKSLEGINNIQGKLKDQDSRILDSLVDRLAQRHNIPNSQKAKLKEAINTAKKDTSAFYGMFGQLTHAQDPLLNMTGALIADMNIESNISFMERSKAFQRKIEELGFKEADLKKFYDRDGWVVSEYDWADFTETIQKIEAQALKDVTGSTLPLETIIEKRRNPGSHTGVELPTLTEEQAIEYKKITDEKKAPLVEKLFTEDYYKDKEQRYKDNNIADVTVKELNRLSIDRGTITQRVQTEGGYPRYTNQDKIDLDALNLKRKSLKSPVDDTGLNKRGLNVIKTTEENSVSDNEVVSNGTKYILAEDASEEARIAFDLNKLDVIFQQENNIDLTNLSEKFLQDLVKIEKEEGRERAKEFFEMNVNLGFTSDFWDSLSTGNDFNEAVEDYLLSNEDSDALALNDQLNYNKTRRSNLLKRYRDSRDSTNFLVTDMPLEVRREILELTELIDKDFRQLSKAINFEYSEQDTITESTPNKAYYDSVQDERLDTAEKKVEFIKKNTSLENKTKISQLKYVLDNFLQMGTPLSATKTELVAGLLGRDNIDNITQLEADEVVLKYAETKLAPYYKAFSPQGFRTTLNKLNDESVSVESVAKELDNNPFVRASNNFSYYDTDSNKYKNENYIENFEGGMYQPKKQAFVNTKFQEMFGKVNKDSEGNYTTSEKNQNLFDLYKEYLAYQKDNLTAVGESGNANLYKAPQVSKTGLEKANDFINKGGKGSTVKEWWRDLVNYRTDELAEGEEIGGKSVFKSTGMRFIPKYFVRNLEESSDVSTDLFYSSTLMAQQAELYKARKKYFSDFMALEEALKSDRYPEGKDAESTQTYKMFRSYVDNNLFGVFEQKTLKTNLPILGQVDIAKIARQLHKWLRLKNLGFNFIVPLTSWVTAEVTSATEAYVGEYMNTHSANLARSEFRKLSTPAIKETMEINSKSRLNVIGQHLGVYDLQETYKDSNYSKIFRGVWKSGYALHTAANFPIIPRVMLNVLYDNRLTEGQVLNFEQFKNLKKKTGKTEAEIKAEWKTLDNKAFYNYMNTDSNSVSYDYDLLADELGRENNEEFREWWRNQELGVIGKANKLIERVDTNIKPYERSAATRHFALSFLTTHRNFLWVTYANRFKNRHFSLQTGREEEGVYVSFANFFVRNFNKGVNNKFKGFFKQVKEDYKNAETELERNNIKRALIEFGALQTVVGIGFLISAMADDDENKDIYAMQGLAYLAERVSNETTSQGVGIMGEFYGAVKSPVIGTEFLKDVFSVHKYFDFDEIKYGKYRGLTGSQKQILKVFPGAKVARDMWGTENLRKQRDTYQLYNQDNIENMNPILWLIETEK